jgi:hypothetical protein
VFVSPVQMRHFEIDDTPLAPSCARNYIDKRVRVPRFVMNGAPSYSVSTTIQVVAPGYGFGHGSIITARRFLEARFEEPSKLANQPRIFCRVRYRRSFLSLLKSILLFAVTFLCESFI